MKRQTLLAALLMTAALAASPAQTMDPAGFSVVLKDFSPSVYGQKTTEYLLHSSDASFEAQATPFQKTVKQFQDQGKTVVLICGKIQAPAEENGDLSRYLRDTSFLNLSSPELKSMSRQFRNSKNPISDVEHFVDTYIDNKTLGIPLLPAVNIIRGRSGDCTEHTVLAVALLRSLGIPSRAVMGMILVTEFSGRRNVFVYHMWAEAFFGGRWVLVDATRPDEKNPNRYIAFAYHSLATEMPLAYYKAVAAIQDLEVRYIKGK